MLKNYFQINENETINSFLKDFNEKKNVQYIILDTSPKTFVDTRTIALRNHGNGEKIKNLKKPLSSCLTNNDNECFKQMVLSGDRVILNADNETYDYLDALKYILNEGFPFLSETVENGTRKEIFALNIEDKISIAKSLFKNNRINILPVIDKTQKLIGELRPIDLLVGRLSINDSEKGNLYSDKMSDNVLSLPIENLYNKKPHNIDKTQTYKEAIEKMIEKKLPSIIVVDGENLYSIISYKDIFKFVNIEKIEKKYTIEIVNKNDMFGDDLDLIEDLIEKIMKKISIISDYDLLKVSFKTHGNTEGGHKRKFTVNLTLSHGNKILHVDKEIAPGTSDEIKNDRNKEAWNIPQMVQEALKILEKKVKDEKSKGK